MWTAPETDELVTTETWQPPESDAVVSATAEPPAAPEGDQLHQFEPPGLASRALEAARQYLSPILGRTELQRLNEGPRDAEGLLPAMSKPIVPLPKYEHQPGDGKLVGLGKAVGNTALGFAEFIESPLGIATGGVGSAVPAAMRATAGRVIAGGFAADLGSKLPEAIGTTRQTLNNPNAPFSQKAEAVLGTTAQGLIVARTGYHAARGRAVNVEAANLEREVTAGAKTEWTPPARDVVLAEAATDAGLNEAPAAIASGGSPVERFIYEAKAKAQNEALDATQRAPAAVMVEPKPWEMDYGQGGEMPRTPAVGGELPNEKTQNQGQTREVLTPPATLEPTELAPNTESKNVPAAAMDANPVTEAKPAPPEQSNLTEKGTDVSNTLVDSGSPGVRSGSGRPAVAGVSRTDTPTTEEVISSAGNAISKLPATKPVESGTLEGWADKVLSQDPRKRTRMGLDPVEESRRLAAVAIKGSYIIARGVRDFAQWSAEIIKQIPELAAKGEAELRRLYARAVDIAEGRDPEIGLSVRGMKIKADTSLSDQVRENTEAAYTKRVAANDIAEAQRLVTAAGGPEKAANDILTGLWKPVDQTIQVKGAGEVLAGLAKLEKAAAEADPVRANELADLQVRVAEFTTRNATTPAQWLQAYNSLYANYSPAAWLKEWRNGIDSARQTRVERATGKPVGESPVEIAQGIADGVADTVRADAPKTAEVIQAVYGSKNTKTQTPNTKAQPPETMPEAIERILGQKGEQAQRTARKIKDFYEREVEKFKRRHKIPELSPEDQRAILAEAKAIERLPLDSLQRREAVLRLLDQLHRRKGFEWWELPIGFWYAHTLSGPTTHAKNILGNSVNLGMEAGLQSLLKPTNIPIILESLGRSLSVGGKEAWSILKTGHDTSARHGDKFELRRNVMELQNGTMDKVLLPWKLVGRFLRAEDAVFFNAGQELRAAILAKRANGESTAAARKAMGWTPEARTAAEAQAASEGLTGLNYQRRVNEIIEQGRAGEVMNAAREFGYDVTFNNEPYGVLGAFTSAINRGFDAAPVLKPFILPFTRIVANVSNSSLNWTPVGSYRALRAQRKLAWLGRAENNGKLYGRAINDPLAIRDAHARALLGTAAIVGITAAAVKNVFDDNPQFMVTGSGPANLDQRKALRAAGWIPYSVKVGDKYISYADKPPQIALAMVGHYLDAIRYKNLDREDALNRVNYALNGSFGVLLQSSWLQGLSSLFNQANRESTKNVMQGITAQGIKTFSGVFVPAALRQLDQFFDPKRYSPDDVQGMVLAQIPWARRNGQPDLNAFGQPVSSPTSKIFYSKVEGDALVRRLAGQRVFPGVPAVGDLLPDEHYALVKYRGPILRELLAEHSDEWAGAPRLIAQDVVNRISSQATAQAKKDLGLDEANSDRREARKLKTR